MKHERHAHAAAPLALDPEEAAAAFAALGSEPRLGVIRLLVRAGPEGMSVGALKAATGAAASTLTHHLRFLAQTGLIEQTREGRSITCRADFERIESLADYLTRECCMNADSPAMMTPQ